MHSSDSERNLLDRLAEEFALRVRRGERPTLSEYIARQPDLAVDIQKVFPAIEMMERLKPEDDPPAGPIASPMGRGRREIPERLGDFRILRFVAEGGMGYVFEAEQESMGRHVALKILKPEIHSPKMLARFLRESKAPGRLHHTNIIPIFGIGECDGFHFYAMQYIHGESLERVIADLRRLRGRGDRQPGPSVAGPVAEADFTLSSLSRSIWDGPFTRTEPIAAAGSDTASDVASDPPGAPEAGRDDSGASGSGARRSGLGVASGKAFYKNVARIGEQAARALADAHRDGVLHRDIKPANLLIDLQGTVWVADFGLAYEVNAEDISRGDIVGTLRFTPPERFKQESIPAGDVYSLGLTLYELVTLEPAFRGGSVCQLMHIIQHEQPRPPRAIDGEIPRDLETIILKAIDKVPARRYATAEAMADDLRAFREDREIQGRRSRWDERFVRWCRREPAVASLSALALILLLTVAVVTSVMSLKLGDALGKSEGARDSLEREHALLENQFRKEQESRFEAHRSGARATRSSGRVGQRYASLDSLREAVKLARVLRKPPATFDELRNEAVASMALVDLLPLRKLPALPALGRGSDRGLADIYLPFDAEIRCLARSLDDRTIAILDAADGRELKRLDAPRVVAGGGFSLDGRYFLATARHPADGPAVAVWDLGAEGATPSALLRRPVVSWAFHPDGRRLALGRPDDGVVTLVELPSGRELGRIGSGPAPTEHDQAMAFSPDGRRLAVGTEEGESVRVYDLERGTLADDWRVGSPVYCVAWNDDGRLLAAGCDDNRIYVRDTAPGGAAGPVVVSALLGHKTTVMKVAFMGNRLVSNSYDETVRVWDPVKGTELTWCAGQCFHRGPGDTLVIEATGADLAHDVVALAGAEFRLVHQGAFGNRMPRPTNLTTSVRFHPGGGWLATASPDGVRLYETEAYAEVAWLKDGDPESRCVAFHPGGRELLTYGTAGLRLWPIGEVSGSVGAAPRLGPPRTLANPGNQGVCRATYSGDGRSLIYAMPDRGLAVVIPEADPDRAIPLRPHPGVRHVSLTPDGRFAATGTWKGTNVKVWDVARGALVHEIPCTSSRCEFSPDGRWLATSFRGEHRLWRVGSWEPGPVVHREESNGQGPMAFSPDGTVLAVGVEFSRQIKLVRVNTAAALVTLESPERATIHDLAFSPDGAHLAAATTDLNAQVWDLRAVRRGLADLGLDWDSPAFPPVLSENQDGPLRPVVAPVSSRP